MEEMERRRLAAEQEQRKRQQLHHEQVSALSEPGSEQAEPQQAPIRRVGNKIGRNEPCPCGSGKKFKACHGTLV